MIRTKIIFVSFIVSIFCFLAMGSSFAGGIDEYTKLLLHCDTDFSDSSSSNHQVTAHGATIDTNIYKFAPGSGSFDGQDDYLSIPDHDDWAFDSGSFTIDFWVRFNAPLTSYQGLVSMRDSGSHFLEINYDYAQKKLEFRALENVGPSDSHYLGDFTASADTWYHIAVVRSGPNLYLFVNGIELETTEVSPIGSNAMPDCDDVLKIGHSASHGWLNGWMDEIRISKGTARWTEDFPDEVPTEPYSENDPPELNPIGDKEQSEGDILYIPVFAYDKDKGDTSDLVLSASNLPGDAVFVDEGRGKGHLAWEPDYDEVGIYPNVHFEVTDGQDTDSEDITITITNFNRTPVLSHIAPHFIEAGEELSVNISAVDEDADDVLTLTATAALPGSYLIDNGDGTGVFIWPAQSTTEGEFSVNFKVEDNHSTSDSQNVAISVVPPGGNHRPQIDAYYPDDDTPEVYEGDNVSFSVTVIDYEGDEVFYSWFLDGNPSPVSVENNYIYTALDGLAHALVCKVKDSLHLAPVTKGWNIANIDAVWPLEGRTPAQRADSPFLGSQTNDYKWSTQLVDDSECTYSTPTVGSDGIVYAASWNNGLENHVTAVNPINGEVIWQYETGNSDRFDSISPVIGSDGTIYIGSAAGNPFGGYFYAITPAGELAWDYKIEGGDVTSSAAVGIDGTIYVATGGAYCRSFLYAFNPDGTLKWRYHTGGDYSYFTGPLAIGGNGNIYAGAMISNGTPHHYLLAVDPEGALKWQYEIEDPIRTAPAVARDGTIYAVSSYGYHSIETGYVYAIYPNGEAKWPAPFELDSASQTSPAVAEDGTIYVGSTNLNGLGHLYAITPDGEPGWQIEINNCHFISSIALGSESKLLQGTATIYVSMNDQENSIGYVRAYNSEGGLEWQYIPSEGYVHSAPSIAEDGAIYFCTDNAYVYAIGSELNVGIYTNSDGRGYRAGDTFELKVDLVNKGGEEAENLSYFVVCDGRTGNNVAFWFWPGWYYMQEFDPFLYEPSYIDVLPVGTTTRTIIEPFEWPAGVTEDGKLEFHVMLMNINEIIAVDFCKIRYFKDTSGGVRGGNEEIPPPFDEAIPR